MKILVEKDEWINIQVGNREIMVCYHEGRDSFVWQDTYGNIHNIELDFSTKECTL